MSNATGVGDVGNSLGYRDIGAVSVPPISTKSLAIEVDTWNSSPAVVTDIGDAVNDHMGIEFNNSVEHNLGGPYLIPNVETGTYHIFRVIWDPGFQVMTVMLDGAFVFAYNGDIITNVFTGNPNVYFGWTAGTGGAFNEHRVCMYRNAAFTTDLTTVCPDVPVSFTDASTSDLNIIVDWAWDFGDGSTSTLQDPSYSYPTPGTYTATLTMTDASGCDDITTVNITVSPDLIVNVVGTDVTCFGDVDGQAVATPTNGTAPYTYIWNDPLVQTNSTATALAPNSYQVDVTDNLGCTGTATVTINEPVEVTVNITGTDVTCYGDVDGQGIASPLTGVAPFTFLWDDFSGQTTGTATNLPPGTYNVTVTDNDGCFTNESITILEPLEFTLDLTGFLNALCFDSKDGQATATPVNGISPFTYLWDDDLAQTTMTAGGLDADTYNVTVTDDSGCVATGSIVITAPAEIIITGIVTDDSGTSNGAIDVTITGGTTPYTSTTWSNAAITEDISGLSSGLYTITVIDANGCSKDTTFEVRNTVGINDLSSIGFEIYPNPTSGLFQIKGDGYYTIAITDAAGRIVMSIDATNNTTVDLTPFENGIYFVRIEKDGVQYVDKVVLH